MDIPLDPIIRAVEFIESHLLDEICLDQIADAAGYSLFHFIRRFNQAVHQTPYDYLMRRRLSEAAIRLVESDRRIIDIAQDFCFDDQETFSRAFRKMFGMPPSQWRKEQRIAPRELRPAIQMADLIFIAGKAGDWPRVEQREEICLRGLMTALHPQPEEQEKQRQWILDQLIAGSSLAPISSIYSVTTSNDPGWRNPFIFTGAREDQVDTHSPSFVSLVIAASDYLVFPTLYSELPPALRYVYGTWMPKNNLISAQNLEAVIRPADAIRAKIQVTVCIPVKSRPPSLP